MFIKKYLLMYFDTTLVLRDDVDRIFFLKTICGTSEGQRFLGQVDPHQTRIVRKKPPWERLRSD